MLNSLFPYGFIFVAILAFLLFVIGISIGMFIVTALQEDGDDVRTTDSKFIKRGLLSCLVGVILCFLYYHLVFSAICRQFSC